MKQKLRVFVVFPFFVVLLAFSGCNGGGPSRSIIQPPPPLQPQELVWAQFTTFGSGSECRTVVLDAQDNSFVGCVALVGGTPVFQAVSNNSSGTERWRFGYPNTAAATSPWSTMLNPGGNGFFSFGGIGSSAWSLQLGLASPPAIRSDTNCKIFGQPTAITAAARLGNNLYLGAVTAGSSIGFPSGNPHIIPGDAATGAINCQGAFSVGGRGVTSKLTSLIVTSDNHLVVAGSFTDASGNSSQAAWIQKITLAGVLVWEVVIDDLVDVRIAEDGNFLFVAGSSYSNPNRVAWEVRRLDARIGTSVLNPPVTWDGDNPRTCPANTPCLDNTVSGVLVRGGTLFVFGNLTELGNPARTNVWDFGVLEVLQTGTITRKLRHDFGGADNCLGGAFDSRGDLILVGTAKNGAVIAKFH